MFNASSKYKQYFYFTLAALSGMGWGLYLIYISFMVPLKSMIFHSNLKKKKIHTKSYQWFLKILMFLRLSGMWCMTHFTFVPAKYTKDRLLCFSCEYTIIQHAGRWLLWLFRMALCFSNFPYLSDAFILKVPHLSIFFHKR